MVSGSICLFVCRWSDKTELDFENWEEGSSSGQSKFGLCVTMSSSSGKDTHTDKRYGFYMLECEVLLVNCREVVSEWMQ